MVPNCGIIRKIEDSYTYDEWGNCTVNNLVGTIGNVNPFRYRGYYFDTESGLYYLMSRYYDPEIGQFISMDTQDYLKPETIGGVDLYAYCGNNPVMRQDPTGHDWWNPAKWNWGLIADVAVTVVAIAAGVAAGIATTTHTGSVKRGIAAGIATAGAVNNAANAIYYNYISDGESDVTPTSYQEGYITRWDRLDYTKKQTEDKYYNLNSWRYYSEYNFHMYAWFATGWAYTGNKGDGVISDIAYSAYKAEVSPDDWERDTKTKEWSWRNWCYIALGLLGL